MSQRKACLTSLAVLLFSVAAHAGEVSMDVRGYSSDAEPSQVSIHRAADEPCDTEIGSSNAESKARFRPKWRDSTAPAGRALLTDDIDASAGKANEATAGSSSSNVALPIKPRNRWQSLVPGAIK